MNNNINPTLGEIKAYCDERGIVIKPTRETPITISNTQFFGDVLSEEIFLYYGNHKDEIDEWIVQKRTDSNQSELENHQGRTR